MSRLTTKQNSFCRHESRSDKKVQGVMRMERGTERNISLNDLFLIKKEVTNIRQLIEVI